MNRIFRTLLLTISMLLTLAVVNLTAQTTTRKGTRLGDNGAVERNGNTTTINLNQVFKNAKQRKQEREQERDEAMSKRQSSADRLKDSKSVDSSKVSDSPMAADDIKLVVDGEGPNKTEATKAALRSAIEQAFGTFVSANTEILNDELVKDEIVTVSSGNIKSYKELSSMVLPNGNTSVSLSAVVSIGKLISYAQSKGASAEFAGQTFMMNMKMRELNKKNEAIALEHILKQLEAVYSTFYDFSVEIGDPKETEYLEAKTTTGIYPFIRNDWRSMRDFESYNEEILPPKSIYTVVCDNCDRVSGFNVPLTIVFELNENYIKWNENLIRTLSDLQLSPEEIQSYKQNDTYIGKLYVPDLATYYISDEKWLSSQISIIDDKKAEKFFQDNPRESRERMKIHTFCLRNDLSSFMSDVRKQLFKGQQVLLIERHSDGNDISYSFKPYCDSMSKVYSSDIIFRSSDPYSLHDVYFKSTDIMRIPYWFASPWKKVNPLCPHFCQQEIYMESVAGRLAWKCQINWYMERDDLYSLSGFDIQPLLK